MSSLSRGASGASKPKPVNVNSLYAGRNLAAGAKPLGKQKFVLLDVTDVAKENFFTLSTLLLCSVYSYIGSSFIYKMLLNIVIEINDGVRMIAVTIDINAFTRHTLLRYSTG